MPCGSECVRTENGGEGRPTLSCAHGPQIQIHIQGYSECWRGWFPEHKHELDLKMQKRVGFRVQEWAGSGCRNGLFLGHKDGLVLGSMNGLVLELRNRFDLGAKTG